MKEIPLPLTEEEKIRLSNLTPEQLKILQDKEKEKNKISVNPELGVS